MAKMQTPQGDAWRKCPSVTHGGAPYFWARRNPDTDAREWYVYDRARQEWRYTDEDNRTISCAATTRES